MKDMSRSVGLTYAVVEIDYSHTSGIKLENDFWYPFCVLESVKKSKYPVEELE